MAKMTLREQLNEAEAAYHEVLILVMLIHAVKQRHEDEHTAPSDHNMRLCQYSLCRVTIELEDAWLVELQ